MNPRVASGLWSQEKLMMVQLKAGYLPHFSVVREDKETAKGRILFDSTTRYGRISLNDTMLPGP